MWPLGDQALVSFCNFFTTIILARQLSSEAFGVFQILYLVILLINAIQIALFSNPMMSLGPKYNSKDTPYYFGAVLVHYVFFAAFVGICTLLGDYALRWVNPAWDLGELRTPFLVMALGVLAQDFFRRYFFARSRTGLAFITDGISYVGQLCGLLFIVSFGELDTSVALMTIGVTSFVAVVFSCLFKGEVSINKRFLIATSKENWSFSKWLVGSTVVQWATSNIYLLVSGSILGPQAVGAIRAAQNIMGPINVLFQGLNNIVPLRASQRFHSRGTPGLFAYLGVILLNGLAVTLVFAIIAGLGSEFWFSVFYGDNFREYTFLLKWLALLYPLMFITFVIRVGLRSIEYTKPILVAYVVTTLFCLTVAHWLISGFALHGAMAGFVTNSFILIGIMLFLGRRKLTCDSIE